MTKQRNMAWDQRVRLMLCAAVLFSGVSLRAQDAGVVARDAWVRVPLPSKTETALFAVLRTTAPNAVVSASSDAADKVEMHEMKMDRAVMVMRPVLPKSAYPPRARQP